MTGSIECVYPLLKHPLLTKCSLFHKNKVRSATCTAGKEGHTHTHTHFMLTCASLLFRCHLCTVTSTAGENKRHQTRSLL